MKLVSPLKINGIVLDKYQLEKYLENIASSHITSQKSSKDTYPIPRLKENFEYITKTYEILNTHLKLGINIHPAGEWLLDNYYIIEEAVKGIIKELPLKKYTNFVGISSGNHKGYARIYVLASEIVAYTDGQINVDVLENALKNYQNKKTLNMEEIWNISVFFKIALIENIREVCEKIYSSQIQKYKVENIIERLVENKRKDEQKYKTQNKANYNIVITNTVRYPFIEHMSYRLKKYGKQATMYLKILEEEVNKQGLTISETIKKEHYDIGLKKITIGNAIKSIRELQRMNILEIFEKINGVEEILKQDPAKIYENMDNKTKEYYRNSIKEISKKTKISEIYITKKALELAEKNKEDENIKKSHIGYYLISKGKIELLNSMQSKRIKEPKMKSKINAYIYANWFISILLSILTGICVYKKTHNMLFAIIETILIFIPITEIVSKIIQNILNKIVKPKLIPKMDFSNGIPKECATMVVIPTIIGKENKAKELIDKLEVYYLANKSENLYFTILGDCSSSDKEFLDEDQKIAKTGEYEVKRLNQKYQTSEFPIFNFVYRKRQWNKGEKAYLGWERKRGLLTQFNEFLLGNANLGGIFDNPFVINTIDKQKMPDIKYIITLDADTDLVLNSGLELVGAMAHILNKPVLNKNKTRVIDGHALMQPRVGIDLESKRKSLFTQIFAGAGGTDPYTNAISDTYQDNFEEGIFTGKGIYDLKTFSTVLKEQIPENTVLSHDLLEGSYLRCALVTDIMLLDGYPKAYLAYILREHRWIRGDWQILGWLKNNVLNKLSKFKILDNLRRSLLEITVILNFILVFAFKYFSNIKGFLPIWICLISMLFPTILDYINYIIFKQEGIKKQKSFVKTVSVLKGSLLRGIISFAVLPHKAYICLNAIVKTIYRLKISKCHMLEWTTSEEAEKMAKKDINSYIKAMFINIIFGVVGILFLVRFSGYFLEIEKLLIFTISLLWIIAPFICCYISRENITKPKINELNKDEQEYVLEIAKRTWNYFETYMNKENNYLPPDNYQEDRRKKIVNRTSSTNIGLSLLAIISAYDLKFIDLEQTISKLENTMETIVKLPKWNGHLYNWYNINNLEPLVPRYISSVDSGNFIGYMFTLKQFLEEKRYTQYKEKIETLLGQTQEIISHTDFSVLYDNEKGLLSIGYDVEENRLTPTCYDLLASEARQASLVAIAKKDIPAKHWNNLSRTLTPLNKYKGLISWSGTAFEYLMPNINIRKYPESLLDESSKFMIMSQELYSKKLGIPWGISESAFNLKDLNSNYQYKAFGIPWLGLKRGLADENVVAPYGSILAINEVPKKVVNNLKILEQEGMLQKYGFYESIDYTLSRLPYNKKNAVVKTYMAHHQGLILLSINNLFNKNILQERFMANPEIKAIDVLLQERMPENMLITKEKKEKVEKIKYTGLDNYTETVYTKVDNKLKKCNIISNEVYSICLDDRGNGFSKYKNILVNRYKETEENPQGIYFYIKNIRTNRLWKSSIDANYVKPDKYSIIFSPEKHKLVRTDENIETTCKIVVPPEGGIEIRSITLKNNSNFDETLEVTSLFEPVLSESMQDYAHMAFNKLFLKYDRLEDGSILLKRNKRGNTKEIYLAANLYTENQKNSDLEYEIDGTVVKDMIENSIPFSKQLGLCVDPVVALKRTIKIPANENVTLNLVIFVSESKENITENLEYYKNFENVKRTFELAKSKAEEEVRYLGINSRDLITFQKMLPYIIFQNPLKSLYIDKLPKRIYLQSELWKYGISGDLPILLIKIKDINDIYVVKQALKAYEYFKYKNINIDLVILDEEKNSYERYLHEAIIRIISDMQLIFMQNIRGGIFLINLNEIEDKELLEFRANLLIKASNGEINTIIQDMEEEYLEKNKNIGIEKTTNIQTPNFENISPNIELEKLKYYNEYGGFSEDGKEYIIKINKENKLPTTWSNVLANPEFGSIVTNNMGGFTWGKNSRLNRISYWRNDANLDIPSEIIYLKDKDQGKSWSLGYSPLPDENDYYITYGFGYAKYMHTNLGIVQETECFVPSNEKVKINILKLRNTAPNKKNLKLIYYIRPVLGEEELNSTGFIDTRFNQNSNLIYFRNLYNNELGGYSYISSSEKISSYTGDKNEFIGNKSINNPEALDKVTLSNKNSLGTLSCIAVEIDVTLEAYESKEISLVLGEEESILEAQNIAYKYQKTNNCREELENTKAFWNNILKKIQVKTPEESMNIMLNGWFLYQTISCRLWARSALYQSGGAYGFRDQLQDSLSLKYISKDMMRNQIIKHCKHQFIEGDVEHWWHEETHKGIRTRFSDDLLWLPYTVLEYVVGTDDYEILNEKVPYVIGESLLDGEDERYETHLEAEKTDTVYTHCVKAIEGSLNFGEHGIPKIGSGDWNDGFSTVGNKGKGESIWLGFFLYNILDKWIEMSHKYKDNLIDEKYNVEELCHKYEEVKLSLKRSLNTNGWDGRWFRRAYMDTNEVLGSIENEECKIDSIAQSWSVISNSGDNDKKYIAMESLEKHLVDKENGIIKLLDPPFENSSLEPGYIKAYLPGVRENGGQYTHSSTWAIIAQSILGFGEKAANYFKMINPIEHSKTKEMAKKYKVEPYVIAADVYGAGNLAGRGGWTWYTGASSWMYKAGIEYILGLKIEHNILKIEPCIPSNWEEYSIKYEYENSIYNIKIKNPNHKNTGAEKFILNGQEIPEKQIKLTNNGKINEVEIIM